MANVFMLEKVFGNEPFTSNTNWNKKLVQYQGCKFIRMYYAAETNHWTK
jgi:hypothetical protein